MPRTTARQASASRLSSPSTVQRTGLNRAADRRDNGKHERFFEYDVEHEFDDEYNNDQYNNNYDKLNFHDEHRH